MDVIDPFPRAAQGSQCIHDITDYYSKLKMAPQISKKTVAQVRIVFIDYWLILYGIPMYLQTDTGTQIVSQFFAVVCAPLGAKHLTIKPYHSQGNGQAEQFIKTILTRLRHNVAER